jgi:hypothetical protein
LHAALVKRFAADAINDKSVPEREHREAGAVCRILHGFDHSRRLLG